VVDAAVGNGVLAVLVDGLDAVAVGIEQEGAVVGRAIVAARSGRAVVAVARVDTCLPERVDLRAVTGAEADVQPAGHGVLRVRRPNPPVVPSDHVGARVARLDAQGAQHGAIEALRRREIGVADTDVVEHRGNATVARPSGRALFTGTRARA